MDYEKIKQIETVAISIAFIYVVIGGWLVHNTYKIDKQMRDNLEEKKSLQTVSMDKLHDVARRQGKKEQTRKPGVGPFVGMEDNTPFDNAR